MKKKLIMAVILSIGLLTAWGCADKKEQGQSNGKMRIVTSFYPMYIMTLNLVQDIPDIELVNLTKPTVGCLHDYQLTPGDLVSLENTRIFVTNGLGMESFMDKVVGQYPGIEIIEAGRGFDPIKNETNGQINPHIWVSVTGAIAEVKSIQEQLMELDPAHREAYAKNGAVYIKKLEELKTQMHQALDQVPEKNIVTFHEGFEYFAREFDLHIQAVIQREPDSQPSAGELVETIKIIKQSGVKAIFAEPQYAADAAETIARETGVELYYLDPAVSGPGDPDAYIRIMEKNQEVLKEALSDGN